jgi:hypothetical protein
MMLFKNHRLTPRSVVPQRMLRECTDTSWYHRALLSKVQEDMSSYFRWAGKPIRVIERPAIDNREGRKSLNIKKQLRTASGAKIDCDPPAAPIGGLHVSHRRAGNDFEGLFLEYGFYTVRSASCSLAKPAMAVHHQHGFRARRVSNCSAKTSALKCHPYLRKRSDISLIRGPDFNLAGEAAARQFRK